MGFLSYTFLWLFFPLCFVVYWLAPKAVRKYVLLAANITFYSFAGIPHLILLFVYVVVSYCFGLAISRVSGKCKKALLCIAISLSVLLLFFFKYLDWSVQLTNRLFSLFGIAALHVPEFALPLGISFYLFTGTGYLIDVYRGKLSPIRNFVEYAGFISFFPTIVSGPIQRANTWIERCRQPVRFSVSRMKKALLMFLWGAGLKMILADRIAGFANPVLSNPEAYHGYFLFLAVLGYSIQIYADFAGYSSMVLGVACALGFDLPDNFRQPYLAPTITEFWRRWHISLTSWFRDYLYIPLGGNRKGICRKYINIMIVFLVSGLWHGAGLTFVVWGGLHGLFQIIGSVTRLWRTRLYDRLRIDQKRFSFRLGQRIIVFLSASFAWVFFRASSMTQALTVLRELFRLDNPWILFDRSLDALGMGLQEIIILFLALLALLLVSLLQRKGLTFRWLEKQGSVFQMLLYGGFVIVLLVYGIYGPGFSAEAFIYAGF